MSRTEGPGARVILLLTLALALGGCAAPAAGPAATDVPQALPAVGREATPVAGQPALPVTGPQALPVAGVGARWAVGTSTPTVFGASLPRIEPLAGTMVTLYAGTGQRGGLDGPALEAQFDGPFALALDEVGRLYVAEYGSGRLRVLDPSGVVRTWLGTPEEGVSWLRDTTSPLYRPTGLASGAAGALYIVDGRQRLLVIHPDGTWGALAQRTVGGAPVQATTGDGDVTPWQSTWDVARGADGTLYLTDALDHRVRAYTREGQTGVVAGSGQPGHQDGPAAQARFTHPNGLVLDGVGNLYIADGGSLSSLDRANPTLRRLTPQGIVETVAGDATPGYADGPAATARFQQPLLGLAMDGAGRLYVADMNNHAVRCLTPQGRVLTVAGTGTYGLRPGPGAQAELGLPADVLWDGRDGLYVADYGQNVIWRVTLPR